MVPIELLTSVTRGAQITWRPCIRARHNKAARSPVVGGREGRRRRRRRRGRLLCKIGQLFGPRVKVVDRTERMGLLDGGLSAPAIRCAKLSHRRAERPVPLAAHLARGLGRRRRLVRVTWASSAALWSCGRARTPVILAMGIDTVSEEVDGVGAVAGGGEGWEVATVVICGSGQAGDTRCARARAS